MDDAQYVLMQDTKAKKRTAHSAAKRVGRSKKCTLPFEMMSKEERKKYMEPKTLGSYKLSPMSLEEFNAMPADVQMEALKWYGEKYGWNAAGVAYALNVSYPTGVKLLEKYMLVGMFKARMKEATKEQKDKFIANRKELAEKRSQCATMDATPEEPSTPPEPEKPTQKPTGAYGSFMDIQLHGMKHGYVLERQLEGVARSLDRKCRYEIHLSILELASDEEQCVSDVADA